MTHRVLNKHEAKSIIQIYSDVMKTIQCAHPPHHHNGFVATCRLWTASGGVFRLQPSNFTLAFGNADHNANYQNLGMLMFSATGHP